MKIKIIGHTPDEDLIVERTNPWFRFSNSFKKYGHEVVRGEISSSIFDLLIVNSHSPKALKRARDLGLSKNRIVMIYWEPTVTYPRIHLAKIRDKYGLVFTPSRLWEKELRGEYFYFPQPEIKKSIEKFSDWRKRNSLAVMILANKFSAVHGQNYSLRRKTGEIIGSNRDFLVDLYGSEWNRSIFYSIRHYIGQLIRTPIGSIDFFSWRYLGKVQKNYLGAVEDKYKTGAKYKINLVIENSSEYVSEKLFEAHLTQAIIVYVGAPLIREEIDPEIAITCEPKLELIKDTIINLLRLPDEEKYKIMKFQNKIARKESKNRKNDIVLANLATSILSKLKD